MPYVPTKMEATGIQYNTIGMMEGEGEKKVGKRKKAGKSEEKMKY
jgi:hypothetical protein